MIFCSHVDALLFSKNTKKRTSFIANSFIKIKTNYNYEIITSVLFISIKILKRQVHFSAKKKKNSCIQRTIKTFTENSHCEKYGFQYCCTEISLSLHCNNETF